MSATSPSSPQPASTPVEAIPSCPFQGRLSRRRLWIVAAACAVSVGLGALLGWVTDQLTPAPRTSANLAAPAQSRMATELKLKEQIEELLRTDD